MPGSVSDDKVGWNSPMPRDRIRRRRMCQPTLSSVSDDNMQRCGFCLRRQVRLGVLSQTNMFRIKVGQNCSSRQKEPDIAAEFILLSEKDSKIQQCGRGLGSKPAWSVSF